MNREVQIRWSEQWLITLLCVHGSKMRTSVLVASSEVDNFSLIWFAMLMCVQKQSPSLGIKRLFHQTNRMRFWSEAIENVTRVGTTAFNPFSAAAGCRACTWSTNTQARKQKVINQAFHQRCTWTFSQSRTISLIWYLSDVQCVSIWNKFSQTLK